jgi:ketosteroid isomerase-like protein
MKLYTKLKLSICVIAIAFIANAGFAQTKKHTEVAAAVEELRKDMVSADAAALNKLLADSLSYGHSSGGPAQTKAQFIESLTSGASVFKKVEFTGQSVMIQGNTAIVRHVLLADTDDKGKGPRSIKLWILLVWTKQHGQWQLLARQAVKLT